MMVIRARRISATNLMKTASKAAAIGAAGAIAFATPFVMQWEGVWLTAQVDKIGTGQPVTACYGMTSMDRPIKNGQKFTLAECKAFLEKDLGTYAAKIAPCVHVPISDSIRAALISMAYNAGPVAVCKSSVVARLNIGNAAGACELIKGWYIRAGGKIVQGLINRRRAESAMCSAGLKQPSPWWQFWRK